MSAWDKHLQSVKDEIKARKEREAAVKRRNRQFGHDVKAILHSIKNSDYKNHRMFKVTIKED